MVDHSRDEPSRLTQGSALRLLLGSVIYDVAFDVTHRRMSAWTAWGEVGHAAGHAIPAPETE